MRCPRQSLLVVALAAAACSASPEVRRERAAHSNQRAVDDALDRVRRDDTLAPITPANVAAYLPGSETLVLEASQNAPRETPFAIHVAGAGQQGLLPGELLLAIPAATPGEPAPLAFLSDLCFQGDACGCDVSPTYHFFRRDDGRVVIARLHPIPHVTKVHVESCGYGCGQPYPEPSPYEPRTMPDLGAIAADNVELVDLRYRLEIVEETCDHPMPYP